MNFRLVMAGVSLVRTYDIVPEIRLLSSQPGYLDTSVVCKEYFRRHEYSSLRIELSKRILFAHSL